MWDCGKLTSSLVSLNETRRDDRPLACGGDSCLGKHRRLPSRDTPPPPPPLLFSLLSSPPGELILLLLPPPAPQFLGGGCCVLMLVIVVVTDPGTLRVSRVEQLVLVSVTTVSLDDRLVVRLSSASVWPTKTVVCEHKASPRENLHPRNCHFGITTKRTHQQENWIVGILSRTIYHSFVFEEQRWLHPLPP